MLEGEMSQLVSDEEGVNYGILLPRPWHGDTDYVQNTTTWVNT